MAVRKIQAPDNRARADGQNAIFSQEVDACGKDSIAGKRSSDRIGVFGIEPDALHPHVRGHGRERWLIDQDARSIGQQAEVAVVQADGRNLGSEAVRDVDGELDFRGVYMARPDHTEAIGILDAPDLLIGNRGASDEHVLEHIVAPDAQASGNRERRDGVRAERDDGAIARAPDDDGFVRHRQRRGLWIGPLLDVDVAAFSRQRRDRRGNGQIRSIARNETDHASGCEDIGTSIRWALESLEALGSRGSLISLIALSAGIPLVPLVSLTSSETLVSLISLKPTASLEALGSRSCQALKALRPIISLRTCRSRIRPLEALLPLSSGTAAARSCRSRRALRARAAAAAARDEGPRRRRNAQRHDLAEISAKDERVGVDDAAVGELN